MKRDIASYDQAEERNKLSHFTVQGYDLNGVIQAGANDGEEIDSFMRMGVEYLVGFEPLADAFEKLKTNIAHWKALSGLNPKQLEIYKLGLHDKNKMAILEVTAGDGKGSSILPTVWDHPEVLKNWNQGQAAIVGKEKIKLVRFDTWVRSHPEIDLSHYDTLQLDTQGNEMEILKGMGDLLKSFKYLCIELSITPVYKGETPGRQVAAWLKKQGFTLDSPIYEHNDCFFVRSDIKPTSEGIYRGRC